MLHGSISIPGWYKEYNILPKRGGMFAAWQSIIPPSAPWQMHFSFFHQTTREYCYITKSFSLLLLHKWLWTPENAASAGCRIRWKGLFLPERSCQHLQLLVSAGHSRSQARQLGQSKHKGITAEVRKPSHNVPTWAAQYVPKTRRCAKRCYRFFFSPLPHGGFLCCRQGSGGCVAVGLELVHPFGRGRAREVR